MSGVSNHTHRVAGDLEEPPSAALPKEAAEARMSKAARAKQEMKVSVTVRPMTREEARYFIRGLCEHAEKSGRERQAS